MHIIIKLLFLCHLIRLILLILGVTVFFHKRLREGKKTLCWKHIVLYIRQAHGEKSGELLAVIYRVCQRELHTLCNTENTPCSQCLYISCSPVSGCLYMEWPILQAGIPLSKDRTLSSACGGAFHFYAWGKIGFRFYKYILFNLF